MQVWAAPACWNEVGGALETMATDFITMLYDTVNKCCSSLKSDPRVMSIYLVGSLASGNADVHSDVDLCILVSKGQQNCVLADADRIAANVGPVLVSGLLRDSTRYSVLYDLYGQIVKVDYDYFGMEEVPDLIKSSMSTRTYLFDRKLLYDCCGTVEDLFKAIEPSQAQTISHESCSPFPLSAWSVIRMVRRGELLEAVDIMNHMRDPLLTQLLCQVYDVPFENYRRMETKLPHEILAWLKRTIAGPTSDEVLTALRELIKLYLYASDILGDDIGQQQRVACVRIVEESTHL